MSPGPLDPKLAHVSDDSTSGWPAEDGPLDPEAAARAAARAEMIRGTLWLAGAAVVTGAIYAAAEPGGTYVVFWGAMAYGAYRFLRALYYWFNPRALLKGASR